ncbi:hypothetical protein [Cellulomonas massiliensis]|uniref:hypothetical protein n=1 Tax=Cellulomonas massiliensis TaxID=1465811 RepID=UPI0002D650B9|nr:hypothetical protein [Cellulomonas massiliensis]
MRPDPLERRDLPGLLTRRPWIDRPLDDATMPELTDTVEQARELVELFDRGLVSKAEFDRQRRKLSRG